MSKRVRLSDAALTAAAGKLLASGAALQAAPLARPSAFPTVSAAGAEVMRHLWALSVARMALTDAANSVGLSIAELVQRSAALDDAIAAAMPHGFLLRTGSE